MSTERDNDRLSRSEELQRLDRELDEGGPDHFR